MLIRYNKNLTVKDVMNKTLYKVIVNTAEEQYELGNEGLVNVDTGCTCGNDISEIFIFEDADEAVAFTKNFMKYYVMKESKHYVEDIEDIYVIPITLDTEFIDSDELDLEIDKLDELAFLYNNDDKTWIKVEIN